MIRRICYSTLVIGVGGFAIFYWLLDHGYHIDEARNQLLLLFVLFENLQTFNSRSERHSVFRQGVFANPMLVASVLAAQSIHIAAMYIPGLSDTLRLTPVSAATWAGLLSLALTLTIAVELDKWWREPAVQAVAQRPVLAHSGCHRPRPALSHVNPNPPSPSTLITPNPNRGLGSIPLRGQHAGPVPAISTHRCRSMRG
ncbi:hypothetical protein FHX61_004699 [Cupriavidus alkaliphilus]|uniref:Cation-transporting P-type ATPase C-terminal domain-containing protein n=1 Tax=Cupriavidus alkaliphilus TaxID=942866 RepID=A0A7W4VEA0_9BURK|nr:hypothetical protein [Cupriavidus alkaliphilus]